jgi:hypothetical protein
MRALTIPVLITRHGYRACHIVNFVLALRMKFRKNEPLERRNWRINRVMINRAGTHSYHRTIPTGIPNATLSAGARTCGVGRTHKHQPRNSVASSAKNVPSNSSEWTM